MVGATGLVKIEEAIRGRLFARDFVCESIVKSTDWKSVDDVALDGLEKSLTSIFEAFPRAQTPNESQTEDDLIWPVLGQFGWTATLRQQNLSATGRVDVPDGLLFADDEAKGRANEHAEEWRRYEHGLALVESKRWLRPLDRRSAGTAEGTAPSTQMLRYLRRVDDLTAGNLRWGILTNGARWRLYYQGAQSVSEQFLEFDFLDLLGFPGHGDALFALTEDDRRHCLRVATLAFRRDAFLPTASDSRTFHQRAIDEGRFYEKRVAGDLSELVFGKVFPELAQAIAAKVPQAPLAEVRDATLVLLYRLLFILYAEDRDLLPVRDHRYDDYAFREKVRGDVGRRMDMGDTFSTVAARYWSIVDDLWRAIDAGDASIGLPPYNGGLFDRRRAPLLNVIRLGDRTMASVIDALSFERTPNGRRYINYRDLSVQQLGSIYERLIEQEILRDGNKILVRPNIFARRTSGSYYTPDDLVGLIVNETVGPLVDSRVAVFESAIRHHGTKAHREQLKGRPLEELDPAESILKLKICDPAMGSGHFLVRLVDYLADRVIAAMGDSETAVDGYVSPLAQRIDSIRETIVANAEERGWTIDKSRLDDRHIIRRMVLKRCVYGVDKNPMAVELAKVSLWLHTFTVGAPLSFLDHHIRCGDSLFGPWVRSGIEKAKQRGGHLFLDEPLARAVQTEEAMQIIEGQTDAEIAEAHRSAKIFAEVEQQTSPLRSFLSLVHALDWLNIRDRDDKAAVSAYFVGTFGDPVDIATGEATISTQSLEAERFAGLLQRALQLAAEERFLNWQTAFPGVWSDWEADGLRGGFDAVIGNPPWNRMKLQQVKWFSVRRREVAMARRAADRKRMIAALREAGDPLVRDFSNASDRAKNATRMARVGGDYPLLARGDINNYSLFVERAMSLVKSDGMVGLLIPSGIASDKTAAPFFKRIATEGRLRALYDFENGRRGYSAPPFFPQVHKSFKFCAFVASPASQAISLQRAPGQPLPETTAQCAFFLQSVDELSDPQRRFPLTSGDFARVNPNTGTAPIFRSRRAAELTTAIYGRLPVLVDRSGGGEVKAWPVKYKTMFHMTNDSGLFRTRQELAERECAWPIGNNRYGSASGQWVPLYEGKMVQAYDHRAASVVIKPENQHRPAQPVSATLEQHQDPSWLPSPQFWVLETETGPCTAFMLAFKDVTAPTNVRSMIAALVPHCGAGNTLPIVSRGWHSALDAALLLANFNAIPFDFVARQKIQGQHLNWFIVEQLPVVPPERYNAVRFGPKTAGEIVVEAVLELTYTAHDLAPFAREIGYVDESNEVRPPFRWDESRRLSLRARLDAVFFHLYGVTDRADVAYVYSTFPIVEAQETDASGRFCTRDLCLAYMNALAAGEPDATIQLSAI